ncbi:MAG: hypothetical protein QXY62_01470 [Candidatus Altiarchaeota archaeon]
MKLENNERPIKNFFIACTLIFLLMMSILLLGCIGGQTDTRTKGYKLSVSTNVKNKKFNNTAVYITVRNSGTKPVTFVKCNYEILNLVTNEVAYFGSMNIVDKLDRGKSVTRDNEGLGENLIADNDGRNFKIKVRCYSKEMQELELYSEAYYEFT